MSDPLTNIEAEAELLGDLMGHRAAPDDLADRLSADDFFEPVHGRIFEAVLREASQGKPYSPVALKSYFETDEDIKRLGGLGYLAKLTGIVTLSNPAATARMLAELSRRRVMRGGLQVASDACTDMQITADEILAHADKALAVRQLGSVTEISAADAIANYLSNYADNAPGISFPAIPALERLLGPVRGKQQIVIAGRPGMGKTALALSLSLSTAMTGSGVLFVSLEMSHEELIARALADLCFNDGSGTGILFEAIHERRLNEHQMRRVRQAKEEMDAVPFEIIDTGSMTTGKLASHVRRHLRRMEAKGRKLELVVVDYLQLLRPDDKTRSAYEAVSEVSRALKAIAMDYDVVVIALAQLSREVEKRTDKRPILSDLRDSGQIEQDADGVLFLVRQEYYLRKVEPAPGSTERLVWEQAMDEVRGKIEFILAKRRNGPEGIAWGTFHGAYQAVRSA